MSKEQIIFIGATGYIGGMVLHRLLERPDASKFEITALVRSAEKAEKLAKFGVKTVVGSLDETAKIEELVGRADYVFQCADADHVPGNEAILRGLKKRFEATGKKPILIHTSGTGVIADSAAGLSTGSTIYSDLDPEQIESIPPTALHRNVDLAIVGADAAGYLTSYIILPSTIWGIAHGPLFDAGISNRISIQIPALIRASLARGHPGVVGTGVNVWPNVSIEDITELYVVLWDNIQSGKTLGHGRDGYYFGEGGEHTMYDIALAVGRAMVELGLAKSEVPTTFTPEEIDKYFGGSSYLGSNSRCRAERSRAIGWQPKHTTKDFIASIKAEVEGIVARQK